MFLNKQALDAFPKAFELESETLLRSSAKLSSNKVILELYPIQYQDSSLPTTKVTEPTNTSHAPLCLQIKVPVSSQYPYIPQNNGYRYPSRQI